MADENGKLSMSNYDLRLDLPACAFINAQLMSLLENGGTAFDAKKQLFSTPVYATSGLDPYDYRMWNHSLVLSLLYCGLVVPREFLDLPQTHSVYREFDNAKIRDLFTKLEPQGIDSYILLRCLRNSIAHALFSVNARNGEWHYEFWTERNPIFRGWIDHKKLVEFTTKVTTPLVNAVLAKKPPAAKNP